MIGAFSTRHPAIAFIPGVRLICHWLLLTSFCPSACSTPRDTRTKRQNNTHCGLYGGLIMLTSRTTTPPPLPISERLRWNIARAGNCLPLACALLFRRLSFGSGASTSRRPVCRTDLYRATDGRENATLQPLDAPRNIRRYWQAQQAPAENAPPHYAQHSGRVRLI